MKMQNGATMRKSYVKVSAIMTIMVLILTGCGSSLPDMTQEEEQMIGEYAANLLLKYDANNRSRLVSRKEVEAREEELQQKEETKNLESTQEGMEPVEDTPVIEIGQESIGAVTGTASLEEVFEVPEGVEIVYQSNEIVNSYPQEEDMSSYFSLDASEGKELLVLNFLIENPLQSDQYVDLLSSNTVIQVTVNGSERYNVLTTMLINDLSTYMGDVPAGGNVDAVLLAEVDSDISDEISSLSLSLKNDSKTCTIQLQ